MIFIEELRKRQIRPKTMLIRTPLRMARLARIANERANRKLYYWKFQKTVFELYSRIRAEIAPELNKMKEADDFADSRVKPDSEVVTLARLMEFKLANEID